MATTPPSITPTPTPPPQRGDRATFSGRVDAFIMWLTTAVAQFAAVATNVYNNALEAFQSATTATQAAAAATQAATVAVNAPGTNGTSTTSLSISTGAKTLTIAQTGKGFAVGQTVSLGATASPSNKMDGNITAFNPDTGAMSVNVTNIIGSGTFSSWVVSVAGAPGSTGIVNEQLAASVASAATVNLNTTTGNLVHITGTSTIGSFTLAAGAERTIIADGAFSLVNSAGLIVPGGRNLAVKVGDTFAVRGDTNGSVVMDFQRSDGSSVYQCYSLLGEAIVVAGSPALNIDFLSLFTTEFDRYVIELADVLPTADDVLNMRLAISNSVVTTSAYLQLSPNGANPGIANFLNVSAGNILASSRSGSFTVDLRNTNSVAANIFKSVGVRGMAVGPVLQEGGLSATGRLTGFRLYWSTGSSFSRATVRIYGIRNF